MASHRVIAVGVLLGALVGVRPAAAEFRPSQEGYYEGTVTYAADFFRDVKHAKMAVSAQANYWFTLTRVGPEQYRIQGEGTAVYNFYFHINWTLAVKMGVTMLNVMGVKIDPKVTMQMDAGSAEHTFYLSGDLALEDRGDALALKTVALSWIPPGTKPEDAKMPKLRFRVIGSLTMDGSESGKVPFGHDATKSEDPKAKLGEVTGEAGIKGEKIFETTVYSFELEPTLPFGTDKFSLLLKKRSPLGPFADEFTYDGPGANSSVGVKVHSIAVQKIDYNWFRRAEEEVTGGTPGPRGRPGAPGAAGTGAAGESGAPGASPAWRVGTVTVPVGGEAPVRFLVPFGSDAYAVHLTPATDAGARWLANHADKTAAGFTVRVQSAGPSPSVSPREVRVDWIAIPSR